MHFKFRAECIHDVNELFKVIPEKVIQFKDISPDFFPDVTVVIHLEDQVSIRKLRNYMRLVPDGHVMVETVQLEDKYTGDRYYDSFKKKLPAKS